MTGDTRAVTLAAIHHAYVDEHPVLHGIDLQIAPGERVALIGTTGAGKTTIARIAAGLEAPDAGHGRGRRRRRARHAGGPRLRGHARRRPAAGQARRDRRRAQGAPSTRPARAGATSCSRPQVGEGGHPLTAAQAQQVALARLALHDPPIAILDEAGAEAGSAGARTLETAAQRVLDGRTALVIAHRLTQASHADRIVVLEHGLIVEQGTHAQLLANQGRYAQLWEAWRG